MTHAEAARPALSGLVGRQLDDACAELRRRGAQRVVRRRSEYSTSHLTYDLDVYAADGTVRPLVWKTLSDEGLLPAARGRRPAFLTDPLREVLVYRELLDDAGLGTADRIVDHVDERNGTAWIVLERVTGTELYQVGELAPWQSAARWLAELHRRPLPPSGVADRLVAYDAAFFARWPERARRSLAAGSRRDRDRLARVLDLARPLVAPLAAAPRAVVHGEFYASNVLVEPTTGRVCPVDWEMAGIGPPLLDVAALVSGDWSDDDRAAIARAYREAAAGDVGLSDEQFLAELDRCRLHQCIQWLGWSAGWVPPRDHASDWLATAEELTVRLRGVRSVG